MLSRTIRRFLLDSHASLSTLPPTFLLPCRARFLTSTTSNVESSSTIPPIASLKTPTDVTSSNSITSRPPTHRSVPLPPPPPSSPLALDASVKEMLPLLAVQPEHYISIHIHGRPYLVREGDAVRLPFHMPSVIPGDVLRLNRASSLGSRDYTLKGAPYLDERIFECRAIVMGTEAEPMRIKEKTKRRNRKVKTVRSKHKFTILKISELKVKDLHEI